MRRREAGAAERELASKVSARCWSCSGAAGRDVARSVGDSRQPGAFGRGCGLATVGLIEGGLLVSQDGRV
jgi:hypothetical protein